MIPIRDENPTRTVPFVNYLLIAANIAAFVWEWLLIQRDGSTAIIAGYGLVATRLVADPLGEAFTVLTSMFMHGGLEHLGGNLLFLYIFGDNVEDSLGHGRYASFYLICGAIAAAAQMLTGGLNSPIAMVGASGAISGVLGAYVVLYPRAPITMLNTIPLLWLFWGLFFSAPAWLVIGYWFLVSNLMPAVASLGIENVGGVALFAHIGGFLGGLLLIRPLLKKRPQRETFEWAGWRPPPRRPGSVSRSRYENWRDRSS